MNISLASRVTSIAAAVLLSAALATPALTPSAMKARSRSRPPPRRRSRKRTPSPTRKIAEDKKKEKKSEQQFIDGYKAARAMLLDGQYEKGIAAFHELGRDEHPDVANYLGYAHRKLGQYDQSKVWYEKALASDPKHTRTLQYYGMWHLEQGNKLKAEDHLERIQVICGQGCEDYRLLREAIVEGKTSY